MGSLVALFVCRNFNPRVIEELPEFGLKLENAVSVKIERENLTLIWDFDNEPIGARLMETLLKIDCLAPVGASSTSKKTKQ